MMQTQCVIQLLCFFYCQGFTGTIFYTEDAIDLSNQIDNVEIIDEEEVKEVELQSDESDESDIYSLRLKVIELMEQLIALLNLKKSSTLSNAYQLTLKKNYSPKFTILPNGYHMI